MASAKPAPTTRRSTSRRASGSGDEQRISPARWGGVALVIAALLGAIMLAVISPSRADEPVRPGVAAAQATPSPRPEVADARVPTAQPRIISPVDGFETGDPAIELTVEVPEEELPRQELWLVVLRGEEELKRVKRPQPDSTVVAADVQLAPGSENELTVALEGPDGRGPVSEPVVVIHDMEAARLEITVPVKGEETYARSIVVTGTSEVGASVVVRNRTNDIDKQPFNVGPAGEFAIPIRLEMGPNKIVVKSTDAAGQKQKQTIRVIRLDDKPSVRVKAPKRVKPPAAITVRVEVRDSRDRTLEGATVAFSLGTAVESETVERVTDSDGVAVWKPSVSKPAVQADELELGISVTTPEGGEKTVQRTITLS